MYAKPNSDIRVEVIKYGLSYREIAKHMHITPIWLSRVMSRKLTPEMRRRINCAIDELAAGGSADRRRC